MLVLNNVGTKLNVFIYNGRQVRYRHKISQYCSPKYRFTKFLKSSEIRTVREYDMIYDSAVAK